ncbi:MAG: glycosyltransferase, partial [Candidatus Omnitrophica bacterium]|nr:glycosyltransferase [Candidatus Omnitrophota bacterium]
TDPSGEFGVEMSSNKKYNKVMSKPTVSLIFPVFNDANVLLSALRSLKNTSSGVSYEVILVDDESTEDMRVVYELSKKLYDKVVYLKHSGNSTVSVNAGVEVSEGEYIQYQNSDVLFEQDGWLEKIVKAFEEEKIGTVGCKTLRLNKTVNHSMRRWMPEGNQSNSHYERGEKLANSSNGVNICPIVAGCGMTTTRKLWNELGGFNVYWPFGWDDADWCFRTWQAGYKVVCQSDAWFYHFGSTAYGGMGTDECIKANREKVEEKYKEVIKKLSKKNNELYHFNLLF